MERMLLGADALSMLEAAGLPVLEYGLARDEDEAARIAAGVGFPVALKISSPGIIHKTEAGGIRLGLRDEKEVRAAFKEIMAGFAERYPEEKADGALVQAGGEGIELITGVMTDPQFGPVLMFGLGGVFVEALADVSFRYLPITAGDARAMIQDLQGYKALANPRAGKVELAGIEEFLVRISRLVEAKPEIVEMDLNPVFVSEKGPQVCDARIKLGKG
jgi:acetate---CoA ligase (ADP-forming) subunit beta